MDTKAEILNKWYQLGAANAISCPIDENATIRTFSAPYFKRPAEDFLRLRALMLKSNNTFGYSAQ